MAAMGYSAEDELLITREFEELMARCKRICKREGEMDNQLCFDESFDETGEYIQTPSEEAMLSVLKALAISPAKEDEA